MGKRKTKTTYEISEEDFLKLVGLYEIVKSNVKYEKQIESAIADLLDLRDGDSNYDRGAYVLMDVAWDDLSVDQLRSRLKECNIVVVKE